MLDEQDARSTQLNRLTDKQCRLAELGQAKRRKLSDGAGLFLLIDANGGRYWRMDYRHDGKRKTLAIGVYERSPGSSVNTPTTSLKRARLARDDALMLLRQGVDPGQSKVLKRAEQALEIEETKQARQDLIARRKAARAAKAAEKASNAATVEVVTEAWFNAYRDSWTSVHRRNVWQSLDDHVFPAIGQVPISIITSTQILDLLSDMLRAEKIETAGRVKQRLVGIWQFAVLKGWATNDVVTPTSLEFKRLRRGALKQKPKRSHPCVDIDELPKLLRAMRAASGDPVTLSAMWLLALTAVRTGELRKAKWSEFDLDNDDPVWRVPVERMKVRLSGDKAAPDHFVPLSKQAVAILLDLKRMTGDNELGWVFPQSRRPDKPISENAVLVTLAAIGYHRRMTGHGFRSLFATITRELGYRDEVVERQLAHVVGNAVQRAYDRAELITERRAMMKAYSDHLDRLAQATKIKVPKTSSGFQRGN